MNKGFSLIELLISLIIISIITAAFAPVLTKKMKNYSTAISIKSDCLKFDSQKRCLACSSSACTVCITQIALPDGYYVDPVLSCDKKACASNCTKCTKDACLSCKTGYIISGKNSNLVTCAAGYYKSGSSCVACANGTYQDATNHTNTSCKTCSSGYVPNSAKTGCTKVTCSTGQYLSGSTCVACPTGCSACSSDTECTSCASGYTLSGGKCTQQGQPQKQADCDPYNAIFIPKNLNGGVDSVCVTKYNAGDTYGPSIPSSVTTLTTSLTNCSATYCCYKGNTGNGSSNSCVNLTNGNSVYNGCNRTVCNWYAATYICANWAPTGTKAGDWRLPYNAEFDAWSASTKIETASNPIILRYKGANGLQFCSQYSNSGIIQCGDGYCGTQNCWPAHLWPQDGPYNRFMGTSNEIASYGTCGTNVYFSARCVSSNVPIR